jgi:signal transduction histidine kinase
LRIPATKAEGSIQIVIEDGGPGLPEGTERIIRRRGGRLDESGSAGLGLAIVQDVLGAYGATIDFSRSDLAGSRVSVTLPARDEPLSGGGRTALGIGPATP